MQESISYLVHHSAAGWATLRTLSPFLFQDLWICQALKRDQRKGETRASGQEKDSGVAILSSEVETKVNCSSSKYTPTPRTPPQIQPSPSLPLSLPFSIFYQEPTSRHCCF